MHRIRRSIPLLVACVLAGAFVCGCGSQGNRRAGRPLIDRVTDLRGSAGGRTVTLVGTARAGGPEGVTLDMRGGTVELPAYQWPGGFVGQTVLVTGKLIDSRVVGDANRGTRVYRLGEVEDVHRSSR